MRLRLLAPITRQNDPLSVATVLLLCAMWAAIAVSTAAAFDPVHTSFEPAEGFQIGALNGQPGLPEWWQNWGAGVAEVVDAEPMPSTGVQALRVSDWSFAHKFLTDGNPALPPLNFTVQFDVYIPSFLPEGQGAYVFTWNNWSGTGTTWQFFGLRTSDGWTPSIGEGAMANDLRDELGIVDALACDQWWSVTIEASGSACSLVRARIQDATVDYSGALNDPYSGGGVATCMPRTERLELKAFAGPGWVGYDNVKFWEHEPMTPRTLYVSPAGDDANDGLSWAAAKLTVQAALDTATSGDQVWVAAGTYVENVTLRSGVALCGGFAGSETDLAQRNWTVNVAILDGSQVGSVVTSLSGATATTRIDGFTIRNGQAAAGGGIYCVSSSPMIANCTIMGNSAGAGGGVYCDSSSPTIANCTIAENIASLSGAGGVGCNLDSSPTITNCKITENIASNGGGIRCDNNSSPTIVNCMIAGNIATFTSGGVLCTSSPMIINCTISGNNGGSAGGGVDCRGPASSPTIINCTITGNIASGGGGLYCYNANASPTITNTIIAFNSSGIYRYSGTPVLTYNCVYGNTAYDYSGVTDPTGTDGNISADPLFRSADPGPDATWATGDDVLDDLRLQAGSPCIDAASNTDVPADLADLDANGDTTEPLPFDLAGRARFFDDPATTDIGPGTPPIVDMGAYEYFPTAKADFDADGDVDGDDLTVFEACATGPAIPYNPAALPEPEPGCTLTPDGNGHIAADFDEDNDVDQSDFGLFQRCYSGEGNPAETGCTN